MSSNGRIDERCHRCRLYEKGAQCPNMAPDGPSNYPFLYAVGMAPGKDEDMPRNDRPFVGRSGQALWSALRKVDVGKRDVRRYNVVNCLPPNNKPTQDHITICSERTRLDIDETNPSAMLVMGNEAISGVFPGMQMPITRVRGSIVPYEHPDGSFTPTVLTFHPSYIVRGVDDETMDVWMDDLQLAADLAQERDEYEGGKPGIETDYIHWLRATGALRKEEKRTYIRKWSDVRALFDKLKDEPVVAWDWETCGLKPFTVRHPDHRLPVDPQIYSAAFSFQESGETIVLPLYQYWSKDARRKIMEALGKWMVEVNPGQVRIAHNLKFELMWGIAEAASLYTGQDHITTARQLCGHYEDTMLMAWLNDERGGQSRLKRAVPCILGRPDWSDDINVAKIWTQDPVKVHQYNGDDAWNTLGLYQWGKQLLNDEPDYAHVYRYVTLPAVWAFLEVELRGMPVDDDQHQKFERQLTEEVEQLDRDIIEAAGIDNFNPASPEQLSRYFTDECGYRLLRATKKDGIFSTDEETLKHLVDRYGDKVAELCLRRRTQAKLNSTYVAGAHQWISDDDRVHGSYNLAGTVTGRTSSNDPNMQNFPKRSDKWIRRYLRAPEGYKLVSFDYGQIEARLFAVITGDPEFCKAIWEDYDIHLENARILFGDERAAEMRPPVKNGTFAMFYGAGNRKIATTTGASEDIVADLRRFLFGRFRTIKPWQQSVQDFYEERRYLDSLFGRRRRAPMSYNELLNHINQSTASDMTLTSMNALHRTYDVALMIHDDLSFFLPDDDTLEDSIIDIARTMLAVPWLYMHQSRWFKTWVPMQIEAAVGDNWCDLEDVLKVNSTELGMASLENTLEAANDCLDRHGAGMMKIAA